MRRPRPPRRTAAVAVVLAMTTALASSGAHAEPPTQTGATPLEPFAGTSRRGVGRGTRVELAGGEPGQLELMYVDPDAGDRAIGRVDGLPFVRVCQAPCVTPFRIEEGEYFVAGPKVMPSRRFRLSEHADRPAVRLDVRPGPRAIRFAGFGLLVGGAVFVPGGGLLVGAVHRDPASDIAGFTLVGTGVALIVAGIVLIVRGRTLVHVPEGVAPSRRMFTARGR